VVSAKRSPIITEPPVDSYWVAYNFLRPVWWEIPSLALIERIIARGWLLRP
jgi:hypothetical protein